MATVQMMRRPFGRGSVSVIAPQADPRAYRTFRVTAPVSSHWHRVSCEEYQCPDYRNGFFIDVDLSTDLGKAQYDYLSKKDKKRKGTMQRMTWTVVRFTYPPGSRPFDGNSHEHYQPIGRPPYYLVHDGDWRGNPTGFKRFFQKAEDWIDMSANHQDQIATQLQKG
jgi:hypothetical protein